RFSPYRGYPDHLSFRPEYILSPSKGGGISGFRYREEIPSRSASDLSAPAEMKGARLRSR
ncbi:MAG: hypothetical protein J4O05_04125, partial [Chloroflexi bacterium]|nr:hypothetical protein [Chloroflexota bacterium]